MLRQSSAQIFGCPILRIAKGGKKDSSRPSRTMEGGSKKNEAYGHEIDTIAIWTLTPRPNGGPSFTSNTAAFEPTVLLLPGPRTGLAQRNARRKSHPHPHSGGRRGLPELD